MSEPRDLGLGVIGVLRGGNLNRDQAVAHQLAGSVLGVGLGAHVDLGFSDEKILEHCKEVLSMIRRAAGNPDAMRAIETIRETAAL